ncbi:MAG: type II toxin-antitoxin system HipA family toxin [Cellulomonas sp.]|nr:type II toxin-antitoxin system HipA family toxin [Cellulomonas sp.]
MTRHLVVLLGGRVVASLERTRAQVVRLTYESDPGRTPLSLSLPIATRTHAGAVVEQFLWGLLPDNDGALTGIERRYGADPRDPMSLLAAVGKDCAGAVQFCQEDEVASTLARAGAFEPCSDAQIEMRLAELTMDERASWSMPGEHWSLGGTQGKFALRRRRGRWYLAQGAEPTTHILKPGIRTLRSQALIEHVSMRAAALLGLTAAETAYTAFKSENALVVTRFDRALDSDGSVTRLHQEDLCQALGTSGRYEEYGGPSALDIITLLREQSATPAQASANVRQFVDGLVYNTVIGAPDAHARNYAVLLDGEDVRLAPLFDVATGLAYGTPGARTASMSIGGEFDLDLIDDDSWRRLAENVRLQADEVVDRVHELAAAVPGAFERALAEVTDTDAAREVEGRLMGSLRQHARRLRP